MTACLGDLSGGGGCPSGCAAALANPDNKASLCSEENEDPLPSPCTAMDAVSCLAELAAVCIGSGGACPAGCADAIADQANQETLCEGEVMPSPCTDMDGLSCLTEVTTACASGGGEGE